MSYNVDDHFPEVDRFFGPSFYTQPQRDVIKANMGKNPASVVPTLTPEMLGIERHQFRDHLGKSGKVIDDAESQFQQAFASDRSAVEKALRRFYDLDDMADSGIRPWIGYDAVREGIEVWEAREQKRLQVKKNNPRGTAHHPEMYEYRNGEPKWAGRGSDSMRVRRYDIELYTEGAEDFGDYTKDASPEAVPEDIPTSFRQSEGMIGCPICEFHKNYEEGSSNQYNNARHGVFMHMQNTRTDREAHQASLDLIKQNY